MDVIILLAVAILTILYIVKSFLHAKSIGAKRYYESRKSGFQFSETGGWVVLILIGFFVLLTHVFSADILDVIGKKYF